MEILDGPANLCFHHVEEAISQFSQLQQPLANACPGWPQPQMEI
jgi:hypothetical protein